MKRLKKLAVLGVAVMMVAPTLSFAANHREAPIKEPDRLHTHHHDGATHSHVHFHEPDTEHGEPVASHSHAITRVGFKPLVVGAMHGLAGSAALTLLVLTQTESALLGLLHLAVFGVGSIIGMLLMSGLVGLPFALSARKLIGIHYGLQTTAGFLSIAFGLRYAYETSIASSLLK